MIVHTQKNDEVKILSVDPLHHFVVLVESQETKKQYICGIEKLEATGGDQELSDAYEAAL